MIEPDAPVPLPVDGALDLHTFRPQDVAAVLDEYLLACRARQLLRVRVIHSPFYKWLTPLRPLEAWVYRKLRAPKPLSRADR